MNGWIINILSAFVLSALLAGVVIPEILLIAFRKNLFDEPDERKIHISLVPRLGGIAFKPVIFFTIALLLGVNLYLGETQVISVAAEEVRPLAFAFCPVMLLYLVGMGDDLVGIRYKVKFIVQILCGIMLIAGGIYISDFHGFLGLDALHPAFAYSFTLLLIVFIINAINLIDGIDGLASGLCSVALIFYGLIFYFIGEPMYALLSFTTLGVLVPFFYYNVFGDPQKQKKIFMGDTGSLTIGMLLCILSIKLTMCAPTADSGIPNPLVLAYSPLIIPCFDVVRVYFGRVRRGKNPFLPDKTHIHHKLLAIGMRQRTAMVSILCVSIAFTLCNILLSPYLNITVLLILDTIIWIVVNMWLTKKRKALENAPA